MYLYYLRIYIFLTLWLRSMKCIITVANSKIRVFESRWIIRRIHFYFHNWIEKQPPLKVSPYSSTRL